MEKIPVQFDLKLDSSGSKRKVLSIFFSTKDVKSLFVEKSFVNDDERLENNSPRIEYFDVLWRKLLEGSFPDG